MASRFMLTAALVLGLFVWPAASPALARPYHRPIRHPQLKHAPAPKAAGRKPPGKPARKTEAKPRPFKPLYTGLIIDATGLGFRPCMSPGLYDADGHNLLSGMSFDPDKVADDGLASWVHAIPGPDWPRTGPHPLEVKAIGSQGDRLVFSDADGAKIRQADAHDRFLEQLKVTVVY